MIQNKKYRKALLLLFVLVVISGYGIYSYWENQKSPAEIISKTPATLETQKPTEEILLEPSATITEIDATKLESTEVELEIPQTTTTEMASLATQSEKAAQPAERLKSELEPQNQKTVGEQQQRYIQLAQHDAAEIGLKIWQNESGGKIAGLTSWNQRENFASLGIGHFIWYSQGQEGPFTETFPDLLVFLQEQGEILPDWLQETRNCPWNSRAEFQHDQQSPKMKSLRQLLKTTISEQTRFIIKRLELALPKILAALPTEMQRVPVREQFYRVGQTAKGVYALIDYVHFKGEGISPTERYQGQGWGLLQVLERMSTEPTTDNATGDFADAALWVLKRRIKNSPPERREDRWLFGWISRLNTYR